MGVQTRKQRNWAAREELIIDAAEHIIWSEGYFGLSIDKLAEAVEYSKGTIYQHFQAKEDIILAIAARSMERRCDFFARASAFNGKTRERMLGITLADQLFVRLYPGHFQVEHLIKSRSLWLKTSPERQLELRQPESRCGEIVQGIVFDAIEQGDLMLNGLETGEVCFGLWTLALGVHTLATGAGLPGTPDLSTIGINHPYESLRKNQQMYMDGIGWRPLSTEWDYEESSKRIFDEVFKSEWQEAYRVSD